MKEPPPANVKRHVRVHQESPVRGPAARAVASRRRLKASKSKKIRILFLSANPFYSPALRLDEEVRLIDKKLRKAKFNNLFQLEQHSSVRVDQLQRFLLQHEPNIVHFSGHGSDSSEILLQNASGQSHRIPGRALSRLFSIFSDSIRCVVLNACYSESQARAIAQHIDCVIGMSKAIGDSSAITFAGAFYQALGFGQSVQTAFDLACNEIDLRNLGEEDTPQLLALKANPEEVSFVGSNGMAQAMVARSDRSRLRLAQELVSVPQISLTPLLIERSSGDPNPTIRHWLNLALGKVGSPAAIDRLRRNLEDPDPFASLGARDALKELGKELEATHDSRTSP